MRDLKLRRNLIIIFIVLLTLTTISIWTFWAIEYERVNLINNGEEVTATYKYVVQKSRPLGGGNTHSGSEVYGYQIMYSYLGDDGYEYKGNGPVYATEKAAEAHMGETIQILINKNGRRFIIDNMKVENVNLFVYKPTLLIVSIILSILLFVYITLIIIFRKKIFNKDGK